MRSLCLALLCAAVSACGRTLAAAGLALADCRLEHPLHLGSVAARCGTLAVPEDPAEPGGRRIALRVAVVPALNRRARSAPLFVLAGGPGQAAADLYASYAGAFARVNRNHDIVLVDQRGTGASAPQRCDYPQDWEDGGGTADAGALRMATRACLARLGPRVRLYTSSIAVQDLERVRVALGYPNIALYGSSYGTRVAELYMRRHPHETHAVVLDGATYPEQAIGPDTPLDGERALTSIVQRCAHEPRCAAAYPHLADELAALRARFGAQHQPLDLPDPSTGVPLHVVFDRSLFNATLRLLSYSAIEAALLPTLLHEAANGNLTPLAAQTVMLARQLGGQLAIGMQNTVLCSEDVPFFDAAVDRATLKATYQGTDQLDALEDICREWPRGPVDADLHAALDSAIPTLLLSGEADPVTPPADAERAARGLSIHRHLVLAGEGHGQLATACVPKLLAAFLDGTDPRTLDASCLAAHRPAPFFVAFTGPAP